MSSVLTPFDALKRAVEIAGGQSGFARLCGKKQPSIWKWLQSSKLLPAEHVLAVEAATGVSRHDLRPDIYPPEHEAPSFDPEIEPPLDFGPVMSQRSNSCQSNRKPVLDERPAA